jgi:hypothetical protein
MTRIILDYGGGCGFPGSAPLKSWRLGGRARGADPGGLVTNWKALPEEDLEREVGDASGTIDTNPKLGMASLPEPGTTARLDQRNLVATPPGGVADNGEEVGPPPTPPEGCSPMEISFGGGALTGETMAFGRRSCGAPAGTGTLWTMGTGPPVSMADPSSSSSSSRLDPEVDDSLAESSESLLLVELELELAPWRWDPAPFTTPTGGVPFPEGRVAVEGTSSGFGRGGLAGAGIEASIAAVVDCADVPDERDIICGVCLTRGVARGVACCSSFPHPPPDAVPIGRDTMRGLVLTMTVGEHCCGP